MRTIDFFVILAFILCVWGFIIFFYKEMKKDDRNYH